MESNPSNLATTLPYPTFPGLTREDVAMAAAKVVLKDGCRATLEAALASGLATHIVSVNWSGDFVAGALGLPAAEGAAEAG